MRRNFLGVLGSIQPSQLLLLLAPWDPPDQETRINRRCEVGKVTSGRRRVLVPSKTRGARSAHNQERGTHGRFRIYRPPPGLVQAAGGRGQAALVSWSRAFRKHERERRGDGKHHDLSPEQNPTWPPDRYNV